VIQDGHIAALRRCQRPIERSSRTELYGIGHDAHASIARKKPAMIAADASVDTSSTITYSKSR